MAWWVLVSSMQQLPHYTTACESSKPVSAWCWVLSWAHSTCQVVSAPCWSPNQIFVARGLTAAGRVLHWHLNLLAQYISFLEPPLLQLVLFSCTWSYLVPCMLGWTMFGQIINGCINFSGILSVRLLILQNVFNLVFIMTAEVHVSTQQVRTLISPWKIKHYLGPVHFAGLFLLIESVKANGGFSRPRPPCSLMLSHLPLFSSSASGNASVFSSSGSSWLLWVV